VDLSELKKNLILLQGPLPCVLILNLYREIACEWLQLRSFILDWHSSASFLNPGGEALRPPTDTGMVSFDGSFTPEPEDRLTRLDIEGVPFDPEVQNDPETGLFIFLKKVDPTLISTVSKIVTLTLIQNYTTPITQALHYWGSFF
jgi:hypothetical protein